jgi:hypothetical protein
MLALVALLQAAAGFGGSATAFVAGSAAVRAAQRCGGEASTCRGLTRVRGEADNAGRQLIRVVGAVCLRDGLVFMAQRPAYKVCPARMRRTDPWGFMWQGRGLCRLHEN